MDRTALTQHVLLVYSGVLTAVLSVVLLTGAKSDKKVSFDEIDVKRLNVVEPDGTVRLILSDKAHFPGLIVKGKEYPHDRQTAGMLFFDDEGTEDGGLIFGSKKDDKGKVETWGHLSFDQYQGDQVWVLKNSGFPRLHFAHPWLFAFRFSLVHAVAISGVGLLLRNRTKRFMFWATAARKNCSRTNFNRRRRRRRSPI